MRLRREKRHRIMNDKKIRNLAAAAACALLLSGCRPAESPKTVFDGFTQGTTFHIVVKGEGADSLAPKIERAFTEIDNSLSLYNDSSLLCRLNANLTDSVDTHIAYCIEQAAVVSRLSDGMYDVTVKPLTQAWGFAGKGQVAHPDLDSLLPLVGYDKIAVENGRLRKADPRMQIDLNSVAQGYTADLIGRLLEENGVTDYLVEVGGEIMCRGTNPRGERWVVGIDRPEEGNNTPGEQLQCLIALEGSNGLVTSGNYRKFYTDDQGRKVAHTINPKTGMSSVSNLLMATVIAPTSTQADALGTMFMSLGLEASLALIPSLGEEIKVLLVYADEQGDFRSYLSPGMEACIIDTDKRR